MGAWIEILSIVLTADRIAVAPSMGAWIEIVFSVDHSVCGDCRSLYGSVD